MKTLLTRPETLVQELREGRYDTRYNDTEHNYILHNDTQHYVMLRHIFIVMLSVILTSVVMLSDMLPKLGLFHGTLI